MTTTNQLPTDPTELRAALRDAIAAAKNSGCRWAPTAADFAHADLSDIQRSDAARLLDETRWWIQVFQRAANDPQAPRPPETSVSWSEVQPLLSREQRFFHSAGPADRESYAAIDDFRRRAAYLRDWFSAADGMRLSAPPLAMPGSQVGDAMRLLTQLRSGGIALSVDGEQVVCHPAQGLTNAQRAELARLKEPLREILRSPAFVI